MRKVRVKASMPEMMHWTLKMYLQIPLRNVKVMWMAELLLVRSQGDYHHALPLIGHHRLLKNRSVNHNLRLSTTLVSGVSLPFDQSFQKEAEFTKDMLRPTTSSQ